MPTTTPPQGCVELPRSVADAESLDLDAIPRLACLHLGETRPIACEACSGAGEVDVEESDCSVCRRLRVPCAGHRWGGTTRATCGECRGVGEHRQCIECHERVAPLEPLRAARRVFGRGCGTLGLLFEAGRPTTTSWQRAIDAAEASSAGGAW